MSIGVFQISNRLYENFTKKIKVKGFTPFFRQDMWLLNLQGA